MFPPISAALSAQRGGASRARPSRFRAGGLIQSLAFNKMVGARAK